MQADHFFTIGGWHAKQGSPCEDYALSGVEDERFAWAAVSDGCGGALADTDIGARAHLQTFRRELRMRYFAGARVDFDEQFTRDTVRGLAAHRLLGAHDDDYLATLVGVAGDSSHASVCIYGDGAFLVKYRTGMSRLMWLEWQDNVPLYLARQLSPQGAETFFAQMDPARPVATLDWDVFTRDDAGEAVLQNQGSDPVTIDRSVGAYTATFRPADEQIEAIAVMTDGLHKFRGETSIDAYDMASAFTNFNGTSGGFVKRTALAVLERLHSRNVRYADDIAIACITFD
ncbi:protein phosphatase 2C domain-containing protein [Paraburkholderia sp. UCT31]|uniref:protein phosphatase 2C domain-containing protein n=1 Tax=Paraburkholderia sp. UCT31 TaxID=2615209 RepID=UPI001655BC6E|nr:protein phosphatase 2C domain-containing protein [Paraburkholderia sp. UCT31]